MDFESLNRRELQSLCKLNKIPANMTNIAMVDALKSLETCIVVVDAIKSLETVEGIEEVLNPSRSETAGSSIEWPEKMEVTSPRVPRTSCRTSTRLKVKETEEVSLPLTATRTTRRGVRKQLAGEVDDFLKTPVVPTTGKKAPATASSRNVASQLNECENTVKKGATVQRVYSTRRSVRLTEKKSAEPSVMGRDRSEPVKIDSFLDEVSVTSEVPEKTIESGSDSIEVSGESNISSEISKAKVEDICDVFEKLDVFVVVKDSQNLMIEKDVNVEVKSIETDDQCENVDLEYKLNILNEGVNSDEKWTEMDNLKPESEGVVDPLDNEDLEEKQNVEYEKSDSSETLNVSVEEQNVVLVDTLLNDKASLLSGADDIDADIISFNTENPIDKLEETSCAVSEMKNEVLECNADVVLVDIVNPNEQNPSMDFEAPAEEVEVPFIEENDFIKENEFVSNANDVIDLPTLHNSPTSLVIDQEEKSINEKAVDEKPKSLYETSMRQLKKQLKALSIKNNTITDNDDKVAETRPALQALCDNQLATGEIED